MRTPPVLLQRRMLVLAAVATAVASCSKNDAPVADASPTGPAAAAAVTPATTSSTTPATNAAGDPRKAFEAASRGSGFVVGQAMAARTLLVFFDPQCPHCATLWTAAKPLRNSIRMVWMPVAFIAPSSGPQGAMLLAAENGTALMDQHESLLAAGRGGLTAMGADEALLAKVKANTALWRSLDATSVPHLVYRAGADGPYGVQSGGLPTPELAKALGL